MTREAQQTQEPNHKHLIYGRQMSVIFRHAKDNTGVKTSLGNIFDRIRTGGNRLAENTATARTLSKTDPDEYRTFKASAFPAFTAAGTFAPTRANNNLVFHNGKMQLDYDHIQDAVAFKRKICEEPAVVAAFLSPSGEGVKVIVSITPVPTNAAEHTDAWRFVDKMFTPMFGQSDPACKDVARLTFLAHDPEAYFAVDAGTVAWEKLPDADRPSQQDQQNTDPEKLSDALSYISPDCSYDQWRDIGFGLHYAMLHEGLANARDIYYAWTSRYAQGDHQYRISEFDKRWDAYGTGTASNPITLGTIFHLARQAGWNPPQPQSAQSQPGQPPPGAQFTFGGNMFVPGQQQGRRLCCRVGQSFWNRKRRRRVFPNIPL